MKKLYILLTAALMTSGVAAMEDSKSPLKQNQTKSPLKQNQKSINPELMKILDRHDEKDWKELRSMYYLSPKNCNEFSKNLLQVTREIGEKDWANCYPVNMWVASEEFNIKYVKDVDLMVSKLKRPDLIFFFANELMDDKLNEEERWANAVKIAAQFALLEKAIDLVNKKSNLSQWVEYVIIQSARNIELKEYPDTALIPRFITPEEFYDMMHDQNETSQLQIAKLLTQNQYSLAKAYSEEKYKKLIDGADFELMQIFNKHDKKEWHALSDVYYQLSPNKCHEFSNKILQGKTSKLDQLNQILDQGSTDPIILEKQINQYLSDSDLLDQILNQGSTYADILEKQINQYLEQIN